MGSYDVLAGCYDRLTYDVDYAAWADYVEKHFARRGLPGRTVLDLACGTGSLTWELARRGYEMIGVDQSPEMLAQAAEKEEDVPIRPLFLCQPMERLDLYGTIDACVCCLDSVNYVTDPKQLRKAFQRVYLFLMPDVYKRQGPLGRWRQNTWPCPDKSWSGPRPIGFSPGRHSRRRPSEQSPGSVQNPPGCRG